jgi:hypothetical protein
MREFTVVSGEIGLRSPARLPSRNWSALKFQFVDGSTLLEAAQTGEIVPMPSTFADGVRFTFKAADSDLLVGAIIELDAQHGYLIRSIDWKEGKGGQNRVEQFLEFPDRIWLPKLQRNISSSNTVTVELVEARVNAPMGKEDIWFDFPEGARVTDKQGDKLKIHIWGKGGPAHTFESAAELTQYNYARLREALWKNPWIWANLILVAALAALVFTRRKYMRSTA